MPTLESVFLSIISGRSDANIKFADLQRLLDALGFSHRVKGDHFIYWKDGVDEIINVQPLHGKAKPYQVKQVRNLIVKYGMEA